MMHISKKAPRNKYHNSDMDKHHLPSSNIGEFLYREIQQPASHFDTLRSVTHKRELRKDSWRLLSDD